MQAKSNPFLLLNTQFVSFLAIACICVRNSIYSVRRLSNCIRDKMEYNYIQLSPVLFVEIFNASAKVHFSITTPPANSTVFSLSITSHCESVAAWERWKCQKHLNACIAIVWKSETVDSIWTSFQSQSFCFYLFI